MGIAHAHCESHWCSIPVDWISQDGVVSSCSVHRHEHKILHIVIRHAPMMNLSRPSHFAVVDKIPFHRIDGRLEWLLPSRRCVNRTPYCSCRECDFTIKRITAFIDEYNDSGHAFETKALMKQVMTTCRKYSHVFGRKPFYCSRCDGVYSSLDALGGLGLPA